MDFWGTLLFYPSMCVYGALNERSAMPNVDLFKHMEEPYMDIPKEPPPCIIVVDTREQKPYNFTIPTTKHALTTGDYSVRNFEDDMSVERKSLDDLVKCVGSQRERFMDQMHRLKYIKHRMLMIDCSWAEIDMGVWRARRVTPNHVKGTLCSIMSMGIPVTVAGDRKRAMEITEKFLTGCYSREWKWLRRKLMDRID